MVAAMMAGVMVVAQVAGDGADGSALGRGHIQLVVARCVVQCYIVTGGSRQGSGGACACTEAWNRRLQVAALRQACHCLWCSAGDVRSGRQQIDISMQALVRYGPV